MCSPYSGHPSTTEPGTSNRPLACRLHGLVLDAGTGQHPHLTRQECDRLYEIVRLFELVASDDIAGAMQLWSRMIPSLLCLWRGNHVAKVKAAARLRGGAQCTTMRAEIWNK
jgi:dihydrodipicolinate synthase/N-acetylneuraminate lyase